MNLQIYRAFWGADTSLMEAASTARDAGFEGLESPAPRCEAEYRLLAEVLQATGLLWNAEICTGGDYVPARHLSVRDHLQDLRAALTYLPALNPQRVNCIAGVDAWPIETSIEFFRAAIEMAGERDQLPCFETHRSRPMFNPWVTATLVESIDDLRLTADISHWCVVAERLMDTEMDTIRHIAPRVDHIHARVGYDQGPQVPHPAAPEYRVALQSHLSCWETFWNIRAAAGDQTVTMTPEFGVDGYLQHLPFTNVPVADLWQVNCWMADTLRQHFHCWQNA